jgi:NAD(P)-dependent dehydrogenase (short-subunit alcohol dehydrogenase family)
VSERLDGRVAIVTGAASGIGRATALRMAAEGAVVIAADSNAERLDELKGEDTMPGQVVRVAGDLATPEGVEAVVTAAGAHGGADILVNNAGIMDWFLPAADLDDETWERVLAVNVTAPMRLMRAVLPAMLEQGRGSIVNIASIYGVVSPDQRLYEYRREAGQPFFKPLAYGASKALLLNVTRYLATYWASSGVRVNTLTLGGVFAGQDSRFVAAYSQRVPLGRMARGHEYEAAVIFLVSDASSYMTGSNMVVDGGWTAW